jgi:hypothetical protein
MGKGRSGRSTSSVSGARVLGVRNRHDLMRDCTGTRQVSLGGRAPDVHTTLCRSVTSATTGGHQMPQNPAVKLRSKILRPPHRAGEMASDLQLLSGRRDLNPRPLDPQSAPERGWASLRRVHWVLDQPEEWLSAGAYGLEPVRAGSWIGSCCLARREVGAR